MEQLTPFNYLVETTPRGKVEPADFPLCANNDGNGGWKGKHAYVSVNIDVAPCIDYEPNYVTLKTPQTETLKDKVCTKYPEWKGKGTTWAADGINEHGLAVSMLAFMQRRFDNNEYDAAKAKNEEARYVCFMDFVAYALSMYKTVDEMITEMEKESFIMLDVDPSFAALGETTHWSVQDATGRNVVVEYNVHNPGKPTFYDNTAGILTNNPDFQWHMTNLNNYVSLSYEEGGHGAEWQRTFGTVDKSHENPVKPTGYDNVGSKLGVGTNFMGIPGDFSPPSRFVRLYYLTKFATHQITPMADPKSKDYAVPFVEQLIATVTIPKGTIPIEVPGLPSHTQWTVIKIPKEKKFYWKGYADHRLKMIDLSQLKPTDYHKDYTEIIEDWKPHAIDMTKDYSLSKSDFVKPTNTYQTLKSTLQRILESANLDSSDEEANPFFAG
jgi:choloylglycine hydrolase